jgi:hypothetical protein
MASILDIAPLSENVLGVPVYGVPAEGIAHLLATYPELRAMAAGREVKVEALFAIGGNAVAQIIAAGTGHTNDEAVIAHVSKFNVEQQLEFLTAILRLTMPKGAGPFAERVVALLTSLNLVDAPSTTAPATTSPKRSKR